MSARIQASRAARVALGVLAASCVSCQGKVASSTAGRVQDAGTLHDGSTSPSASVQQLDAAVSSSPPAGGRGGAGGAGAASAANGGSSGAGHAATGGAAGERSGGAPATPAGGAGAGGAAAMSGSYTLTGAWPARPSAIPQRPGKLVYTKLKIDDRFLAESCSIADYNRDGVPDISAGRRWYEGPFGPKGATREHVFRAGHDALPRNGTQDELDTGVADDWACYAQDVDADGYTDIINIACPDMNDDKTPDAATRQHSATAVWYKNPGAAVSSTSAMWRAYPMHDDVRGEQHGLSDLDGDGRPEIYGACKGCGNTNPDTITRGYYQMDVANPTRAWTYHAVTKPYPWPGGGWLHGFGFGDVNLDGKIDLLERAGIWTHALAAKPDQSAYYDVKLHGGDASDAKAGGAHMFAVDVDGDADMDIVSSDAAHGYGISWYEQTAAGKFTGHRFVGTPDEAYPLHFSQPHAMEVVDMDGDGVSDVITGKTYLAHPEGLDDPDLRGDPVNFVFKVKRNTPSAAGSVTFEPHPIDTSNAKVGVGRQIAVGHIDSDGIMDVCVASKLGVYVFLGQ